MWHLSKRLQSLLWLGRFEEFEVSLFGAVARQEGLLVPAEFPACSTNPSCSPGDRSLSLWEIPGISAGGILVQLFLQSSTDWVGEKLWAPSEFTSASMRIPALCYGALHSLKGAGLVWFTCVFSLSHLAGWDFSERRWVSHLYALEVHGNHGKQVPQAEVTVIRVCLSPA